jgi:hypothetical protein
MKEGQLQKLRALARKEEESWASVVRDPVDFYFLTLEANAPELTIGSRGVRTKPPHKIACGKEVQRRGYGGIQTKTQR